MERVAAMVRQPVITGADLAFLGSAEEPGQDWLDGDLPGAVARIEAAMIARALEASGGNRSEAARRLDIHRQLVHTKMRQYGLESSGKRTADVANQDTSVSGSGR